MASEKNHTAQLAENARKLKLFVTLAGFAVFFACLAVGIYLLIHNPLTVH